MPEGRVEGTSVSRGVYKVNGRPVKSISVRHVGNDGHPSHTYDADTGLLLFGGSTDRAPSVTVVDMNTGQTDVEQGAANFVRNMLVSVRETNVAWAAEPTPAWAIKGRVLELSVATAAAAPTGLPPAMSRM